MGGELERLGFGGEVQGFAEEGEDTPGKRGVSFDEDEAMVWIGRMRKG